MRVCRFLLFSFRRKKRFLSRTKFQFRPRSKDSKGQAKIVSLSKEAQGWQRGFAPRIPVWDEQGWQRRFARRFPVQNVKLQNSRPFRSRRKSLKQLWTSIYHGQSKTDNSKIQWPPIKMTSLNANKRI